MSGKCSICDVSFNSERQKTDHFAGTKHRKKEAALRPSVNSTGSAIVEASASASDQATDGMSSKGRYPRMCDVCPKIELTSETMAKSHLEGEKHKKRLKQYSTGSPNKPSASAEVDSDDSTFYDAIDGSQPPLGESSAAGTARDPEMNIDYCDVCRILFNHRDQAVAHYKGKDHERKAKAKKDAEELKAKGCLCYYCDDCTVLCNTLEQLTIHKDTSSHQKKVGLTNDQLLAASPAKIVQAPTRDHAALKTAMRRKPSDQLVKRTPRKYQEELYEKAMKANTICFLPTGMGKTLTSTLVVSHMLQANDTRQVVFVVDRKILVFQQADAMIADLADVRMPSFDSKTQRSVRIASVCGDKRALNEGCRKLYEHDLIVITAGSYLNLLKQGELRWEDVSCLVLDEAHHCTKKHPYNVLMKEYYHGEPGTVTHRPKVLGLTASPAGDISVPRTEDKLKQLMGNMDSRLEKVTTNEEEFLNFKPTAKIRCEQAFYSAEETQLGKKISGYAKACIDKANGDAKIATLAEVNLEEISKDGLDTEGAKRLSQAAQIALTKFKPSDETVFLLKHLQNICGAWSILHEAGVASAVEYIRSLKDELSVAKNLFSLPVDILLSQVITKSESDETLAGEAVGSGVRKVLDELLKLPWEDRSRKMFALVLVQRREAAAKLQSYLSEHHELTKRRVRTARIVGHGKSGQDGVGHGMTTAQQKKAMQEVREGYYQIIVATSVAEEGLDLPECRLVVQMDVPRTVTSLVQIRGRARERGGEFVAICRQSDQEMGVEMLKRREEFMEQATTNIVKKQMMRDIPFQ